MSVLFMLILIVVGFAYIYITSRTAEMYIEEQNQAIYAELADNIVEHIDQYTDTLNGNPEKRTKAIETVMMHLTAFNPGITVYILDSAGTVKQTNLEDNGVLQTNKVKHLECLDKFIETKGALCVKADDPRTGEDKVFSAARYDSPKDKAGYVYVVLGSAEHDNAVQTLMASYYQRLAIRNMVIALIASLIMGMLLIWYLTRNLRVIVNTVKQFSKGNLDARINVNSKGEWRELSNTFNRMADTIVGNIKQLKASEKFRRELIANVSHDLRTPLAVIHGYIETLIIKKDNISSQERNNYIQTILKSTEKLRKLVTELFEFSKLEANQIQARKEPFFIHELAHDIAQGYQVIAQKKNIQLSMNCAPNLPLIEADIALIERVFQNILDNAVKFTPDQGTVEVDIRHHQETVAVKIIDSGIGISEADMNSIFDRYHTHDRSNQNLKGMGLGLSIVKRILEIHDADFSIDSKEGVGTTFSFNLPIYKEVIIKNKVPVA